MSDNDEKEKQPIVFVGDKYGISKPLTALVQNLSTGFKNWFAPSLAKKRVKAKEIEAASESNEIQQTVKGNILAVLPVEAIETESNIIQKITQSHTKTREEENMEAIINLAKKELPPRINEEDMQEIDEDWMSYFSEHCKVVSDKDMQILCARMYVSEATKNGTISEKTIDLVSKLDKKDADLFTALCQFVWLEQDMNPIPLIYDAKYSIYNEKGINLSVLQNLESIGLILTNFFITHYEKSKPVKWRYHGTIVMVQPQKNQQKWDCIPTGEVSLTKSGEELFRILEVQKNDKFFNYVTGKWQTDGLNPIIQIPKHSKEND